MIREIVRRHVPEKLFGTLVRFRHDVRRITGSDRRAREKVSNAFLLLLGREASEQDIAGEIFEKVDALAARALASAEFELRVLNPLRARRALDGQVFAKPPPATALAWAARYLAPRAAAGVLGARSWYELYAALFMDPAFQTLAPQHHLGSPELREALADLNRTSEFHHVTGGVEESDGDAARGWVVDLKSPDRALRVELWVEGVFAAAAPVDRFRREIQDLYGGSGVAGFSLPLHRSSERSLKAEVREPVSGAVIGSFGLEPRTPPLHELARLRGELAAVRAALERIEGGLPQIEASFSFPISAYDAYAEAYEGSAAFAPADWIGPRPSITVVVQAMTARPEEVEAFLASLVAQAWPVWEAVLICPKGDAAHRMRGVAARVQASSGRRVWVRPAPAARPFLAHHRALSRAAGGVVVFAPGEALLAPGALHHIGVAAANAVLVYGDDDRIETEESRLSRRSDPHLRSAFDLDMLLQQPVLGELIAVRREAAVAAGGFRGVSGGDHLHDLALRMVEQSGAASVRHTPHVLIHRCGAGASVDAGALRMAVAAHLSRVEPQAFVEPCEDILGAAPAGSLRVRRPHLLAGQRAAIIIPTRDRLDLLRPCIESLVDRLASNRVSQEIVVVDNGSREAETLAYLDGLRSEQVRVERYDAPFNWASINNFAAQRTEAEVLVFLNNDTVALTRDWCDALCEQALRPHVAAVGARLVYGDGTIQHGGVVLGVLGFAAHEAVGQPGGDPGYLSRQALTRRVSAVTGACFATRAEVFRRLGGFDGASFPVDGNDIDYCIRAADRGFEIIYTPDSTLYHLESKSRGYNFNEEQLARERRANAALWARWGDRARLDPYYSPRFARDARPFARLRPFASTGSG